MTIQMKNTEQYFSVVSVIMMCKVVLALESLDEILKGDYSYRSCLANPVRFIILAFTMQDGSSF